MPVIKWVDPNADESLLIGFVGEATNEAFRLEAGRLESNITGKEGSYEIAGADASAKVVAGKSKAEALLVEHKIPEKTATIN